MSHNSRPFIPSEANREEPRTLHNTWRKFYEPDRPLPPPPETLYPFFALSSAPPPPTRDWWGAPPPGAWQPPAGEGDSRRLDFTAPPSGRGNVPPPPPREYDAVYPDRPASPDFSERPSWGGPRTGDWLERPVTPFNERSLVNDHWSPGTASSSARDRDRDWDRDRDPRAPRGWSGSRRTVSPSYSHADRPLLEPSQAWKDRERQMSFEQSAVAVPGSSTVSDFQARRFRQPALPPPPPPPGRTRYSDRFVAPPFPRRSAPRRSQQRISARISARPKREPSPSSSESSARSRSRSRSHSRPSRSPRIRPGWERKAGESTENLGIIVSSRKSPSTLAMSVVGSSATASENLMFHSARTPSRDVEPPRRKPSASPSWSTQSSIRSSVHSSPRLVTTELEPAIPRNATPVAVDPEPLPATGAVPPPQEDTEFELPGMRFLKYGALKPGPEPPNLNPEIDNRDTLREKSVDHETELFGKSDALDANATRPGGVSTEVSEHPQAPDRDSLGKDSQSNVVSPLSLLPSPADHSLASLQPLQSNQVEAPSQGHDISQVLHKRDVDAPHQATSHQESSNAIDPALAAPESSPLSEPVALSPPPDIPELQDDMDDSSSMSIDDSSSSTSSSSSGPADDIAAALRVFVKARDGKDLQWRSERYAPILRANHSLLDQRFTRISTPNEELVQEVLADSLPARLETHADVSRSLLDRFTKQAEELTARTRRLRAEYKSYHDLWVANCRKLDQNMASSASQGVEGLPVPSGRVTRRSAAFSDTVRSDLEMEQIIASLGNEDMTDPNVLAIRNTAIIPNLVSTDPFAINLSFDDDNGLVDDPAEFFDAYDALGRWTDEEKQIFIQKYGVYPKQFGAIASSLPNKTPAQCVMFYYLHKKELIDFRAAISTYGPKRRRRGGRKAGKGKGNALLADIVKPPRAGVDEGIAHKHSDRFLKFSDLESGRLPTRRLPVVQDNEGEPSRPLSTIVARGSRVSALQQEEDLDSDADSAGSNQQSTAVPPSSIVEGDEAETRPDYHASEGVPLIRRFKAIPIILPGKKAAEADVGVASVKKPKQAEKGKEKEKRPPGRPPKKSKERAKALEKAGGSSLNSKPTISYVWSKGEEAVYLGLVARYGKDFEKIAEEMPAKTALQCRNYFRSHAKDLDLERMAKKSDSPASFVGTPASKDSPAPASNHRKKISIIVKAKSSANGDSDAGSSRSNHPRGTTSSKNKDRRSTEAISLSEVGLGVSDLRKKEVLASKRLPNSTKSKREDD